MPSSCTFVAMGRLFGLYIVWNHFELGHFKKMRILLSSFSQLTCLVPDVLFPSVMFAESRGCFIPGLHSASRPSWQMLTVWELCCTPCPSPLRCTDAPGSCLPTWPLISLALPSAVWVCSGCHSGWFASLVHPGFHSQVHLLYVFVKWAKEKQCVFSNCPKFPKYFPVCLLKKIHVC